MPLPRFERLPAEERARPLDVAASEFARHGYEEASLNRILKEAGMSKGALYYYFTDKDDLFATVLASMFEKARGEIEAHTFAPASARDFWPALARHCREMAALAVAHPDEMRVLRSFQTSVRASRKPAFQPIVEIARAHLAEIVEKALKLGATRTDVPPSLLVEMLEAVDEPLDRYLFASVAGTPSRRDVERAGDLVFDTMPRILNPAPTRKAAAGKKRGAGR